MRTRLPRLSVQSWSAAPSALPLHPATIVPWATEPDVRPDSPTVTVPPLAGVPATELLTVMVVPVAATLTVPVVPPVSGMEIVIVCPAVTPDSVPETVKAPLLGCERLSVPLTAVLPSPVAVSATLYAQARATMPLAPNDEQFV